MLYVEYYDIQKANLAELAILAAEMQEKFAKEYFVKYNDDNITSEECAKFVGLDLYDTIYEIWARIDCLLSDTNIGIQITKFPELQALIETLMDIKIYIDKYDGSGTPEDVLNIVDKFVDTCKKLASTKIVNISKIGAQARKRAEYILRFFPNLFEQHIDAFQSYGVSVLNETPRQFYDKMLKWSGDSKRFVMDIDRGFGKYDGKYTYAHSSGATQNTYNKIVDSLNLCELEFRVFANEEYGDETRYKHFKLAQNHFIKAHEMVVNFAPGLFYGAPWN